MKTNSIGIKSNSKRGSIQAQARCLMSQNRQRQQNRQLAMLHRIASDTVDELNKRD